MCFILLRCSSCLILFKNKKTLQLSVSILKQALHVAWIDNTSVLCSFFSDPFIVKLYRLFKSGYAAALLPFAKLLWTLFAVVVADVSDQDGGTAEGGQAGEAGAVSRRRAPASGILQATGSSRMLAAASSKPLDFQVVYSHITRHIL